MLGGLENPVRLPILLRVGFMGGAGALCRAGQH
jgi:hypothetical protein